MSKPPPFQWTLAGDPSAFQPKRWIVRNFLMAGEVAVLVAPPATGKSAVAARLALDVRAGQPFLGQATNRGAVLFVAAEREHETRLRIVAMRGDGLDVPVLGPSTAGKIDLREEATIQRIIATMRDVERTLKEPVRLVVLDTLARCMPGAEENSAREMGVIADALSRIASAGVAVVALHHPARNGTGVRGSSAIDGAVDRILELKASKAGLLTLKVKEANSGPCGAAVQFRLEPVGIGYDEDGEPITAVAVRELGATAPAPSAPSAEGMRASIILDLLHGAGGQLARKELLEAMRAQGALSSDTKSSSEQLRKALLHLKEQALVDYTNTDVWLPTASNSSPIPNHNTPSKDGGLLGYGVGSNASPKSSRIGDVGVVGANAP